MDVGIKDGKIAAVGDLSLATAKEMLDVEGLVVSPGFIDMHSHSDLSLPSHRRGESSLSQGITTEVVGSCGWSMAPVKDETRNGVLKGLLTGLVHRDAHDSLDWSWHSFGEFMDALEAGGIGVNVAPQVGQSLIRAHVVGTEKRDAAPGEIEAMKALVRQAMEDGAWGMSTGRSYKPGGFAPASEVIELARVVAGYGGIYATHMRDEGEDLFGAVGEVLEIAEKAGVRAEISHHKAIGRKNFGKVSRSLEMIEKARKGGLEVTVDTYPYEFAQASALVAMLPREAWARLKGHGKATESAVDSPKPEEVLAALKNPATVERFKGLPEMIAAAGRIANYLVVKCPSAPGSEGRMLEDIASEAGKNVIEVAAGLLVENGMDVWAAWPISIDDVHTVISAGFAMGGTDAFNVDRPITPTAIHPRHFGTFPRIVGRFVREDRLFPLEEAVRKCTHMPAQVMGIRDRGLVEPGYWADLVVFDPDTLIDTATGPEPYRRAGGIERVLVNGKMAMEKGQVRAAYAGKVLRKK